ncbi:MAG: N-acetyl-gamma-glutamyl-phosphate reductase [Aquificaceae bacterium]
MEQKIKVCIFGPTGYTGGVLISALIKHPFVKIASLVSSSHKGKTFGEVFAPFRNSSLAEFILTDSPSESFDVAFLCTPHEVSLDLVPKLIASGVRVIDLSGAYRLKDPSLYPEFYGFSHSFPDLLEMSVYGLSELFRRELKAAKLVANPGCYPTATLLALAPLLNLIDSEPIIVDALSGISGAGRTPKQSFHFPEIYSNAFAYSVLWHRHRPEIELIAKSLSGREINLRFTPQVIPISRGMMVKVYLRLNLQNPFELFKDFYKNEPFVKVISRPPEISEVIDTNICVIYPFFDEKTRITQVIAVIDNLGKGASLQAVQNMNIMFNIEETTSLELPGRFI